MKILLLVLYFVTIHIYAATLETDVTTVPHVVNFSFAREQLPQVHKLLEKVYNTTKMIESSDICSAAPTGVSFNHCTSESYELEGFYEICFMPIAEIFRAQMSKFLRTNNAQVPALKFRAGVPGAYVSEKKFFEVCKQPMLIHRDSAYLKKPTENNANDFTLIISENFVVDKTEGEQLEQILVGTSVYNQYGKNPVHIVAKQPGEITVVMISQHSMHSTSHECIPVPFKSNPSGYSVKRAIFQGYFTGPDLDQIDWDEVAKITDARYNLSCYKRLKTQLNALYTKARVEYDNKVKACGQGKTSSHHTVARKIEEQFKELNPEELNPSLEDYNIYRYLTVKREISEFTDAYVAALNTVILKEAVSKQIIHVVSDCDILEAHEKNAICAAAHNASVLKKALYHVMPSPRIDFSLMSLKHIHFLLFNLGITKFNPIIAITSACDSSNKHKPNTVAVNKKSSSAYKPPAMTMFRPKNTLKHYDDDRVDLDDEGCLNDDGCLNYHVDLDDEGCLNDDNNF